SHIFFSLLFFFNDPAPTEIYTLSLHDALPISAFLRASASCGFDLIQLDVKSFSPLGVDSGFVRLGREISNAGLQDRVQVASDPYSLKRGLTLLPRLRTLMFGGVITTAIADLILQNGIQAVGVRADNYQASTDQLV